MPDHFYTLYQCYLQENIVVSSPRKNTLRITFSLTSYMNYGNYTCKVKNQYGHGRNETYLRLYC